MLTLVQNKATYPHMLQSEYHFQESILTGDIP